jgi:hypothetical protein
MVSVATLLGVFFGAVLVVLAALFVVVTIRHNLRISRVRRAYRTFPKDIREQVLRLIQDAARRRPSVTFLRLDDEHKCDSNEVLLQSHVGGVPYAEAGDEWPTGSPGQFLLQVRLDEPGLGQQWQGRLLTVFLVFAVEQVVRSYAAPSRDKYVPLAAPLAPLPCIRLTPIRLPVDGQRDEGAENDRTQRRFPASPARLCELVPAIPEVLSPFTNDPAGLLSQILRPDVYGYDLEAWQVAYEGGDRLLIQNPHDPTCDHCGGPLRFLFQFGEIIPGVQLADAGVCYVYGCDHHPGHCKGFIDSH